MFILEILLAIIVIGGIFVAPYIWFNYIMQTDEAGAPWVPMDVDVVAQVLKTADLKKGEVFYELGSGDGRLVIAAASMGAKAIGVELDKWRVLYSRFYIWLFRLNKNAQILNKNIFDYTYEDADVVCLYLLEETNEKLKPKFEKELRKGTRVVSTGFVIPGWKPVKVNPRGTIYGPIYLYVIN